MMTAGVWEAASTFWLANGASASMKPIAVTVKSALFIAIPVLNALRLELFMGDMTMKLSIHKLRIVPTRYHPNERSSFDYAADRAIGGAGFLITIFD
jgi:hypothetical protein